MPRSVGVSFLTALFAGALFVTSVTPLNAIVLIAWIVIVALTAVRSGVAQSMRWCPLLTHFLTFLVVTMAAHFAPGKTFDDHYSERVRLPRKAMSVADIENIATTKARKDFPVQVSMTYDDATRAKTIRFASNDVSLGEFIQTIEDQTSLRHRFLHCGNAFTILWGYPPSYYLMLREELQGEE